MRHSKALPQFKSVDGNNTPYNPKPPYPYGVIVCFAIGVFGAILLGTTRVQAPKLKGNTGASIASHKFVFMVADTPETRQRGLSNQPNLSSQEGMLFVMPPPEQGTACFWMKDMKFSLDILWFNSDKRLLYQQQDISPETFPQSFCPPGPASYVVEVKGGTSAQLSIKTGDPLQLEKQ